MRILYLEDNPNDAELTLRVFKSHDPRAKLITAGDVHTALGIIQSHPADYFDIFLSDFELPDGDAIQFLEAIHQRGLFQPVVVVTGNDDPQVRNRTLAQGIAGFLYKEGKYLETLPEKIEKIHKSYRENRKRQSVIRVLYAEHNPVDAELTQLHFASHAAHIVLQVISSATELERTCQPGGKNPEYDVIVLDTDIQRQGDLSLLQKLKAEWKIEQPVILLTAPGEDRLTVQALQMGAENSVIKNIGYFQLLPAIIEVAFTKSRLMKEQKISLERERLFRLMTENARDIVFRLRFSPDFGFDYISAAVKRLTGYSPEEFYENPSFLMELVDPEDFSRLKQMLAKPTRFGKPIILRWHTRDGRLLWVEAKGSFIHDLMGKFVAFEGIARDITERMRFESALQAENERRQELETIINKSPVIVVRWKPKVRQPLDYISANISSLGYKAKDFLDGKILYEDIVHPDDVKKLESEVSQHAQTKDMQYRMRYRLITKKGETRWIDDLTWVVKDDQGTPLYHQGIVTDITSRMQVEQALEQAESQYHQLVDQIPAVTYVDRNDGVATNLFTSPQIESVVGYTPQEWMEDPGLRFRTIHPDDLERVKAEHERTNLTGKPFHMEYRLIHKDGRVVWVDDRSALLRGPEGEPDRWQGVLVDITERKAREEELHKSLELFDLALKGADLGFWDWDIPVGKFYFSPRCAEMLEYQPQEIEPTVKNWDSMTHPDDLQREYKAIDEHFQGISPSFEIDLRVRTKPGEYKWAQIRGKVIERKKDGTPLRAAGTLRDITSQKKIEEEEQRRIKRNQDERQSIIQLALDPAVSSGDFDVAIQHLTENVAKVLGVERASVWMYTEGEDGILCTDLYERSKKRHSKGLILQARDYPTYFESLRAGRAIAAQDACSDPRTFEFSEGYLQPLGIASLLDSTIRVRSQMVGVVCFEHIGEPRHWHQDEITYGGEIADQVAQVILNLERHTAEEATRSNEVKFRTIIEQSAEGFVLLDADGFVIDWNRTTEKLFEIARKDAIGHYFWDLLYRVLIPEHRTGERYYSLKKAIQAALKRDQSPFFQKPIEAEIVNLKGEHVFIQQTIFPLSISGQRFLGSFIQDITDRKNAEQGVRESEARFKALFEQANDAIFLMDGDRFIDCNQHTEMIFGVNREEIIGKNPFDFSPAIQTDGQKSSLAGAKFIRAAFLGKPQVFEWLHLRKDGTPFDAEVSLNKVEIGGKPFLQAMVRDISERKKAEKEVRESENRFRSIFEQANDAILILDENKLVDCNQQTELLFGWKRNEFLGKSPPELSPETQPDGRDSDEAGEEKFELALQGTPQRFEWVHLRKNGTLFDVEASLNRIEIGGKAMVQAIIRDITERKLADLSLKAAEKRYRGLFEDSPISLWEEDFSEVKEYLDSLKKRGVKDFHRYLHKHPETIQKCLNLVKVIDVNRATLKLYEAAQKDDLLKNLDRVMTEESNRWFVKEIEEIAEGKTEFRWEGLNRTLSGKDILVDLRWAAAPGFEETLSKVIISIEDITERKQFEIALKESEQSYRTLTHNLPGIVFRIHLQDHHRIQWLNEMLPVLTGYTEDEVITNFKNWEHTVIIPEDYDQLMVLVDDATFRKKPYIIEYRLRRKDGEIRYFSERGQPVYDDNGKPLYLDGIILDVTERHQAEAALQESEKRYRDLFENSPIAMLEEDFSYVKHYLDGLKKKGVKDFSHYLNKHPEVVADCLRHVLILDVNRSALRVFRVTDKSEILQNLSIIFPKGNLKSFIDELVNISQGIINFHWETINQTLDGEKIDVDMHWSVAPGYEESLQRVIISSENITDRVKAQADLHASETRYRGLFEDSPISLWEEDFSEVKAYVDGLKKAGIKNFKKYVAEHPDIVFECAKRVRVLDVNQATVHLYKAASKKDLLTKLDKVFCEESLIGVVDEILHIAEGKYDFEGETVNQTIDGQKIEINLHWTVAPGYEDSLSRVIISIMDITEKKKAEVELRQSEEKYRELFERMESAVAVYQAVEDGNDFEFLDFNSRAEEIEGLKRKQVLGKRVTEVFPGAAEFGILEIFKRVWQTGQAEFYPAAIYKDENRRETWRENWIYRLPDGKIVAIYADVTQRQQTEEAIRISEARYRSLVENQTAVISRTDLDGNLTFVNDEFCKVFGRKKEELLGNRIESTVFPEDQHLVGQAIKEAMNPPYHSQLENRNVTVQGTRWFRWENSTILDSNGKIIEMQYVGWDFTEQKNAQMALQRRDEILEAVSFTATRLLVAADWKKQAPIILEKLGRAAHVDRVYLLEYPNIHHGISLSVITDNLIEWVAPGVEHRLQDASLPGLSDFSQAMNRWKTTLTRGEVIVAAPGKIPKNEQSFLDVLGIKGMVLVPILLQGTLWGLLGFDQVTEDHPWDETEMEALKTFADTFASAIQRNKAYEDLLDRETRLHAILEASKDAILVSIHDTTMYANTAFRKLFGLSLQDDLEDTSIESLIAPTDRKRYREISQDRQNGKPAPTHYELKALKKSGAEFDLEIHVSTYELMGETYTLALLRDITDKKQHDRELEALASVSTTLRKARTREEMCPIIVDQLVKVMQADGGLLMLEEPVLGDMVVQYSCGEFAGQEELHMPAGQVISGEVKRSKKPHVSHDLLTDPLFFRARVLTHCKQAVFYPMIAQKKVIGILLVSRELPFDKTEIKVIGSIAEMAANAIFRSELHEQTESQLQKLIALRQIDNAISSTLDLHQIINTILTSSQKFLKVDAADILLFDPDSQKLKFAYGIGFRTNLMKGFAINSGDGWAGEAARTRKPIMIPDINQPSDKQINPAPSVEELVSYYVIPLITNNQVKGVMECFTRSPMHLDQDWKDFINLLAGQAAIAINSAQLFDEIKLSNEQLVHAYDDTIEGWSRAMDIRDKETEGHTLRVVDLTLRFAGAMGVPEDQLIHIKRGTLLHDIGKLVVPDSILFKPSSLNDLEWKIMKKHPLNAYNMLVSVDYLKPALDIPYCHHEHWDGSGYPRGLKGEEIPLAARIFSVVDIWDALLSDRPYRPAWTREKTLAYIKSRAGEDLDPKVVKVFLKIISESK